MIISPDALPPLSGTMVVDPMTGYTLNYPLGLQEPPSWWVEHADVKDRVVALREEYGITVEDDMLESTPSRSFAKNSTKKKAVVKPKPRPRPAVPRPVAVAPKFGTKGLSARERACYLQWSEWEHKGTPGVFPAQLRRYWLGEGLARWATTPTPYRSLVAALRSERVPGHMIHGLAARLYHWHFGKWPGKRGKKAWDELRQMQFKFAAYELETK